MLEIKVQCDCGQRYKFDVEPLNGRMPFTVNCPICGADGTEKANAILAQIQPAPAVEPAPPATTAPRAAPRLRISTMSAAPPAVPTAAAPPPQIQRALSAVATTASPTAKPAQEGNFVLGSVGAVAGGLIGMLCWFLLIKLTHYEIGYVAWGVGVLTGVGARMLCRSGGVLLGLVAAVCAFFAIIGGEYLYARSEATKELDAIVDKAYRERMAYAKEAAAAQSDEEIRAVMAKHESDGGQSSAPTAEQLKAFKEDELPKLREFAQGKISKAEFGREFNRIKDSFLFKVLILKESVGLFTLLWLFLGVTSAYKLGAG